MAKLLNGLIYDSAADNINLKIRQCAFLISGYPLIPSNYLTSAPVDVSRSRKDLLMQRLQPSKF